MRGTFLFFLVAGILAVLCLSAPAFAESGDLAAVDDADANGDASITVTKGDDGEADGEQEDDEDAYDSDNDNDNEDEEEEDSEDNSEEGSNDEGVDGAENEDEDEEEQEQGTEDAAALETAAGDEVEGTHTSCRSLYRSGKRTSGYYQLSNPAFKGKAYCNMRQGGWQLCAAIPAGPAGSNFKFGRQNYGSVTSRAFSRNCERYMKKGAVMRVSRSRSVPRRTGHNQCTLRDNSYRARTRRCAERRNQFAWWVPRANGCYRRGNQYRFSVLRSGLPKSTVCMRNRHWIGSNSCQCFNSHGAWHGRRYTGMLYLWVMESKNAQPRRSSSSRRRSVIRRKPIRRVRGSAGGKRRRRRIAVRKTKKSRAAIRKAQHRARVARIRARHSAFKSKVTSAVQRYATAETQRLIKWFIGTYLDKDAVSMAKPLEKKPVVKRRTLDPEPGPSPSDPEPFEIKHRRKPDSPGTRDDVIPIPGLITEKNKDAKIDVYPPKP